MTTFNYLEHDFDDVETDLLEDGIDGFGDSYATWLVRPQLLNSVALPTIRSIEETELICSQFGAVLTAGPSARECRWNHPNHRVWTFEDSCGARGPRLVHVEEMLQFGVDQEDLLVHCHAGISRSTATAWGIAIARGADPAEAFEALKAAQPLDTYDQGKRLFCPNRLLVEHVQEVLGRKDLLEIRAEFLKADPEARWWE
jgi:hypothetical protein